jgi:hypothetical protein
MKLLIEQLEDYADKIEADIVNGKVGVGSAADCAAPIMREAARALRERYKEVPETRTFISWNGRTVEIPSMPELALPQHREWCRLTDDEIADAADAAPFHTMVTAGDYIYILARAIEQAAKEKNK